ncbi:hypothetical protein [Bacillus pumilus]|uniref:hypothetical protein n=1 Tax=Bacillus pumilus TaxID=1408 RepID=UPI0011E92F12|nr:hypothetical protein [Bacillus pumilus]TYS40552.1 hypothetical protein FZC68_17250 [Bacillus pumilus]
MRDWSARPVVDINNYVDRAVLIICEDGAFEGGLKEITESSLHIEVNQGRVISVDKKVLENELTELYVSSEN